jgi:hypothetical protein
MKLCGTETWSLFGFGLMADADDESNPGALWSSSQRYPARDLPDLSFDAASFSASTGLVCFADILELVDRAPIDEQ